MGEGERSENSIAGLVASRTDTLRASSRVPPPRAQGGGKRDEALRVSAWKATGLAIIPCI